MKTELELYQEKTFEDIKHTDDYENEYWYARELMSVLGYKDWRSFHGVVEKAQISCSKSNNNVNHHFVVNYKTIKMPKGANKDIIDYKLNRYACYLIVQNANPKFKTVALGQTYFAIQTRKAEITEQEFNKLSEEEKRLYRRGQTKDGNKILYLVAKEKGVKNFDRFTNYGYKGLYGGETADDIAKRKGLRYREEILDNMGSEELGANVFRITQTEALLKKQNEKNENIANQTHYKVGKAVRETIEKLGGTMPEKLPSPNKSIKQIEKEEKKKLASSK